jgi:hypothetical protein
MSYHVKRATKGSQKPTTELRYSQELCAKLVPDINWNKDTQTPEGLSNLFEANKVEPAFTNFIDQNEALLNIGLLDNNIIPLIDALNVPMFDNKVNVATEDKEN